jgi:hypothetical protein
MKYQFSESASGPSRFLSRKEMESADLTYASASLVGGNKRRMSRVSNSLEALADTFRDNIGISKEDFYRGADDYASRVTNITRGMGFDRT